MLKTISQSHFNLTIKKEFIKKLHHLRAFITNEFEYDFYIEDNYIQNPTLTKKLYSINNITPPLQNYGEPYIYFSLFEFEVDLEQANTNSLHHWYLFNIDVPEDTNFSSSLATYKNPTDKSLWFNKKSAKKISKIMNSFQQHFQIEINLTVSKTDKGMFLFTFKIPQDSYGYDY
jgi:hypothetical protein